MIKPDFVFETSWEICNKVGGIYTVLSTKADILVNNYKDNYILIGPDIWKRTTDNPDFIEDPLLFREWKNQAVSENIKIRIGRWNIPSKPIAILIDFTTQFAKKDEVFAKLWEDYQLDSLSGGWDYIEPALFGYEAGRVIKSFYHYYLSSYHQVVAHFHEWMTGTGVLFLKKNLEQIGVSFTTHATTLGRSIAGNNLPLYSHLDQYDPSMMARQLKVVSKHSLESLAAQNADAYTTVSEITSKECLHFFKRKPDVITINGFDKRFVPKGDEFNKKKIVARKKLLEVASRLSGKIYNDETILILTSGRYEFKNKGIDLYIQSLEKLSTDHENKKNIVAYIAVPAGIKGPSKESKIIKDLEQSDKRQQYLTHYLHDINHDPVINSIVNSSINNPDSLVQIVFVPAYLEGRDGIFNIPYYDLLIGFDLTVFPSYYEPWGYTPMESIAFGIPTITTSYAGFGTWINKYFKDSKAVVVIDRNDENDGQSVNAIYKSILTFITFNNRDIIQKESVEISERLLWGKIIHFYYETWAIALQMAETRKIKSSALYKPETYTLHSPDKVDKPNWKKILVKNTYPDSLKPLKKIAMNIWWSWNENALELFEKIDHKKWILADKNPLKLIESLSLSEINKLETDKEFIKLLNIVYKDFKSYIQREKNEKEPLVAYFSMEYGLHSSIRIYSGGLGILAGDYLKQASDSNKKMVAVGLLYRHGYFQQLLSVTGDQIANYTPQVFTNLPLILVKNEENEAVKIKVAIPGSIVYAKIWKLKVGSIDLYLLDTDTEENNNEDKKITFSLYGGDNETRLKQEVILGLGGARLLKTINIEPDVFHCNEGHAAFLGLDRIRHFVQKEELNYYTAKELVRSTTLFTTHTPVPAGHDKFEEHLIRAYFSHFPERFNISWEEFMALGKVDVNNPDEKFSMSVLALNLSQEVNGVSKIHGRVSREMFRNMFPHYFPGEINIGHVTNGVHYHTWTSKEFKELYSNNFDKGFINKQSDQKLWSKIYDIPDKVIWEKHLSAKQRLIDKINLRLKNRLSMTETNPKFVFDSLKKLDVNTLIIGFARRFATYKRAHLLFSNIERLKKIVNNSKSPVIFLFAGKAHPSDKAGQNLIKRIIEISKMPEFTGHVLFLENYDMDLGHLLTSGVDVWLNTPTRPLEASGTSGEKAIMNGVLNFSVLDGWWAEGYQKEAGWAIEEKRTFEKQEVQDMLDAEFIYETIKDQIVKTYYKRNDQNIPEKWVLQMKNTIAWIAPQFNMQRMLEDYYAQYYIKLGERNKLMFNNHYEKAHELSNWKQKVLKSWELIKVISITIPDPNKQTIEFGKHFIAEVNLDIAELSNEEIGVEVVMGNKTNGEVKEIKIRKELIAKKSEEKNVIWYCDFPLKNAGVYDYAFRIFPKHELLTSRMDFPLVKWV